LSTSLATIKEPLFKPPYTAREIWFLAAITDLLVDNLYWFYESYEDLIESYEPHDAWSGAWQVSFARIYEINKRPAEDSLFHPFEGAMELLITHFMDKLMANPRCDSALVSERATTSEVLAVLVPYNIRIEQRFMQLMMDYWLSEEGVAEHYKTVADIIFGDFADRKIIPLLVKIAAEKFSPEITTGIEYTVYPSHAAKVLERLVESNDPTTTLRFYKPTIWTALYPLSTRFEVKYH